MILVHEFYNSFFGRIGKAPSQAYDAGVSTAPFLKTGRNFVKNLFRGIRRKSASDEAPLCKSCPFCVRYKLLHEWADFFCAREGCSNTFAHDERRSKGFDECRADFLDHPEFSSFLQMTHRTSLL